MPLMLSGDTDQYSNAGFIGPAYQKAAVSLGVLNNASVSALQDMGINTQADYQTARSDVLDELARLNYSASQIAAAQRGGAPLLKAGWSNASKFVGTVDNGPRIEVYPADASGNGPQMTVYPTDSPHPSEYFITTPIIQDGKMALGTAYPALLPRGWKEFILTTPADSGLPPMHVIYSEGAIPDISSAALGERIDGGGNKDVYEYGDGKVVAVLKPGKPVQSIVHEVGLLDQLNALGIPTVNASIVKIDGKPAMLMDRFVQGSKEIVATKDREPQIVGDSPFLNMRSIRDLQNIANTMVDKKIKIDDLQFLIGGDGRVVVADPLAVSPKTRPSSTNLRTIDLLIQAARKNGGF